ncbi:ATP/GTP-binding protein [Streptomyces aculeolatus]
MLMRRFVPIVVAAIALVGAVMTAPSAAQEKVTPDACKDRKICPSVTVPGHSGGVSGGDSNEDSASGGGGTSARGKKPVCTSMRGWEIPCNDPDLGTVSGHCYYKPADPQPPKSDPEWEGNRDGAIYVMTCPGGNAGRVNNSGLVWLPDAPGGGGGPQVDPAQLAQEALDDMTLEGAEIGVAPDPDGEGLVGMPVWVWTERGPTTWGPNTASASAGGITVTVTANVSKIRWEMGDGTSVTCSVPGKPYKESYGMRAPAQGRGECGTDGYELPSSEQSDGTYTVTATSTWDINWTGGGQSGEFTETRSSQVEITVVESQVLN